MPADPSLSIIVIGYRMPRQLEQTLFTLSSRYQLDVKEQDYEVIVVENESDKMLSEQYVSDLGSNFRYFRRKEESQSPVSAVNFAFSQCRGEIVGLMIDGAHMVTPRVIKYVLMAHRMTEHPVVVVPGYHLGGAKQSNNAEHGYSEAVEQEMLGEIGWKENGYRLFDISEFSPANKHSYLHPIMECNCLFAPMLSFERIGYCDPRFTLRGGGSVNLHIYRYLGTLPESEIVVIPGEGSFHQFHGGISTSQYSDREQELTSHREQLNGIWGGRFQSVRKEPILLGAVTHWAQRFLQKSSENAQRRYRRLAELGRAEWEDAREPEPVLPALSIEEAKSRLESRKAGESTTGSALPESNM